MPDLTAWNKALDALKDDPETEISIPLSEPEI